MRRMWKPLSPPSTPALLNKGVNCAHVLPLDTLIRSGAISLPPRRLHQSPPCHDCLFLARTASAPAGAQLAGRLALALSGSGRTSGTGAETAFARSVTARYAGGVSADVVRADLAAQGFKCVADGTCCTRAVVIDPCVDRWSVYPEEEGSIEGALRRICMSAEAEDE